ncbi:MAG: HAD family hydrolase [bacterium]|nr:HAD family hydrolase [bacterium]
MMKPALLFDIDGTLLYAKGIGRPAFAKAFQQAYGVEADFENVSFVGATDTAVIRTMAAAHEIPSTPSHEEAFYIALTKALDDALAETPPYVYPGVKDFLEALVDQGYTLGIVTGNIRTTAWAKLLHANLATYFSFGATSADHYDRDEIAKIAYHRAQMLGCEVKCLIGDTPKDIQAAHAIGVPALAVATGWIDAPTLLAAGADACLENYQSLSNAIHHLERLIHNASPQA